MDIAMHTERPAACDDALRALQGTLLQALVWQRRLAALVVASLDCAINRQGSHLTLVVDCVDR